MARVDTTPDKVLESFVLHLRGELGLNEFTCYETVDPDFVEIPNGGGWFVTVAAGDGQFPNGLQEGGGASQTTESMAVIVTFYNQLFLDPVNVSKKTLHDANRGLFQIKRKILKSLCGVDLQDADENEFLRQLIPVQAASRPQYDPTQHLAYMSLTFLAEFDWDLSS